MMNDINTYNFFAVIIVFILLFSCEEPNVKDIEFRHDEISGIVDSIAVYHENFTNGKNHFVWIKDKKYFLYTKYYYSFIKYVEIGDSISKNADCWEINVYKKQNNKMIKKYFKGAKDYWD